MSAHPAIFWLEIILLTAVLVAGSFAVGWVLAKTIQWLNGDES